MRMRIAHRYHVVCHPTLASSKTHLHTLAYQSRMLIYVLFIFAALCCSVPAFDSIIAETRIIYTPPDEDCLPFCFQIVEVSPLSLDSSLTVGLSESSSHACSLHLLIRTLSAREAIMPQGQTRCSRHWDNSLRMAI